MYNVFYTGKNSRSNNNTGYRNSCGTKQKRLYFQFHLNNMRNYFILSCIFFSIVLPLGIQPAIYANYVFAQTDVDSIDDSIDEEGNVISPSKSKSKLNLDASKNGFTNENIITLDNISDLKSSSALSSQSGQSVQAQSSNEVYGDFNGDGFDDLAIKVPQEDVDTGGGTFVDAGAVNILYGSSNGLSATSPRPDQIWTQSTTDVNDLAETDDAFGWSLASGDFNSDGRDDLAIGLPFEDLVFPGITETGAVNVLYGSSNGLSATSPRPDQIWTQDSPDVNDFAEINDFFGVSLSAGDFNGDGRDDLAIGVAQEDVLTGAGDQTNAGAVNILYGSSTGLSATSPRPDQFWTQSTMDVNDFAETGDVFGSSLSAGDFNGDGKDDLAIGVPDEDVLTGAGDQTNAGAVNILYGSSTGLSATSPRPDQFWTQSTTDVNDLAETVDVFGNTLLTGDFNGDGRDDLAIGALGEDLTVNQLLINNAGAVNILYGSSSGLSATSPRPDQFWTQSTADVNDLAEGFDRFGQFLYSADFNGDGRDDLGIAVPGEDLTVNLLPINNAGAVNILYGSSNGLSATSPRPDQFWTQSTTDVNDLAEPNDSFGAFSGG